MAQKAKGGKKQRKWGRKARKAAHQRYNAERRWIRNKKRQLVKHLKTSPNDKLARNKLSEL